MSLVNEIVRCKKCGAVFENVSPADAPLGEECAWEAVRVNTEDGAAEKHLPVVERRDDGVFVKVGEAAHPMLEAHYIQWIEVIDGADVFRHHLLPGEAPEAFFRAKLRPGAVVRAYCNIHGLWTK